MAFEIGTKNCIECESENSPKKGITAVQNPINPRAFSKRGKPIRGERLTVLCHMEHCDSTAAHLRDQSDDVCVLELKEGKKNRSQAELFPPVRTCFPILSHHVLVLPRRKMPVWIIEQLCPGMYVHYRLWPLR